MHAVATMCRVLEVSASGYYAWKSRMPSKRLMDDGVLQAEIETIHRRSRATYGVPRVHAELRAEGTRVGRKRVARLMRRAGLEGASRRKRAWTTKRDRDARPAPDLVERDFSSDGPDRLWVADITYIPTWGGFLYLAVVLDAYSRKIVGWATAASPRQELALEALHMAIEQRRPRSGLIHHTDRGGQYSAAEYQEILDEHGIQCSMSRPGNCLDNAVAESFFHTLKTEWIYHAHYKTRREARLAIFEYIEGFYNTERLHSSLDYRSPEEYERERLAA